MPCCLCLLQGAEPLFQADVVDSFANGVMSGREASRILLQGLCPPAMLTWMGFRSWTSLTMPSLGEWVAALSLEQNLPGHHLDANMPVGHPYMTQISKILLLCHAGLCLLTGPI